MRAHALLSRYAPFIEAGRFARVVAAPFLVAARLQPSFYPWGEGWIDLVFSRDGEMALVPFVQIDAPMVYVREASPFIWPSWLPLETKAVAGLEALLEPWLLSHTLLGSLEEEIVTFFTDDAEARATFEAARAAHFLCATSADELFTDVAPYVYAQRFAVGKRVGISSGDGGFGASMLARVANSVHADLGDAQRNRLAQTWYGIGLYGEIPQRLVRCRDLGERVERCSRVDCARIARAGRDRGELYAARLSALGVFVRRRGCRADPGILRASARTDFAREPVNGRADHRWLGWAYRNRDP